MKSHRIPVKSIPLAFALITILAYGLLLPFTGFYWDDWPFAWTAKFLGPPAFIPAFLGFRPFLGLIFFITTSLIPPHPILWQIFALIIRFIAAMSIWWSLDQIWPEYKRQTLMASFLLLVFPGYSQNWVAFTHINQEWIPFIFYLLSFGFTARAIRKPEVKRSNTIYALLLLVAGIFPTEYFFSLEPFRFLFIWVMISAEVKGLRERFIETFRRWWPYLVIWILDAIWLAFYYRSGEYISYGVSVAQTIPSIGQILSAMSDALWKAGAYIWVQVLFLSARAVSAPTTLLTMGLILIVFPLSLFYFIKIDLPENSTRTFAVPAILIGLIGILLGRIPSLAAGLPLTLQSSYDRFMISMMLGGSLFITGMIDLLISSSRAKIIIFSLLVAFGTGQQFFNANIFRRDWLGQQQIYWEFAWRIPALKPNTAMITQQMPLDYETDLSMTAPLNWIYAKSIQPPDLPYALLYTEKRLGGVTFPNLQPGTVLQLPYRNLMFHGSTSQAIVIYVPPNGCLRVLDPVYADAVTYSKYPAPLTDPIPLSDPTRIVADAPSPVLPDPPFTHEPEHTWCFYYEKAELARQIGDWQTIVELGAKAASLGYAPRDAFEWLPFIEANARTGNYEMALTLARQAWATEPRLRKGLCELWNRVQNQGPGLMAQVTEIQAEMQCTP